MGDEDLILKPCMGLRIQDLSEAGAIYICHNLLEYVGLGVGDALWK